MKWLVALSAIASLQAQLGLALDGYTVPIGSAGFQRGNSTAAIQFDGHSLFVNNQRQFIFSGEFHPWRLPSPQMWSDVLQKMKAGGFNTVSIYINWSLIEGKRGKLDWSQYRSITEFYEVAKKVGIYVIARVGPYINAEASGGGFPGWLTNVPATARSNQTGYIDAWQEYIKQFGKLTGPYQFPDGPVIAVQSENEFYNDWTGAPTATEYMVILDQALYASGIHRVPLTCNDVYPSGNYATGRGQVDLYGFDSYPGGFNCSEPELMPEVATYYANERNILPQAPMYLAEFQGGSLDGWGGVGYDNCEALTGTEFTNVFYKNNIAQGAKMQSFYMTYGGTNWGNTAYPGVYTSYDYGASIREDRSLAPKFSELKQQALFLHASPDVLLSDVMGTGTNYSTGGAVFTTNLASPSSANFYVVRQTSNNYTTPVSFGLKVNTNAGMLTIPQYGGEIMLDGRESKIIATNYPFGANKMQYSTAEIMTQATIDGIDYIVLYVNKGQQVEAVFETQAAVQPTTVGSTTVTSKVMNNMVVVSGAPNGVSITKFGTAAVIVADKLTAQTFWNPRLGNKYDLSSASPSIIATGPYLLRNATVDGTTLQLRGDVNVTTSIGLIIPKAIKTVKWNSKTLSLSKNGLGMLSGSLAGPVAPELPSLAKATWKFADSFPERNTAFDDSKWTIANRTTTVSPVQPIAGKYVLYADDYGYHQGSFIFRGYFQGSATAVNLTVEGGASFGFSAFLNGQFLGSAQGQGGADTAAALFTFPKSAITGGRNVLTVVQDDTGREEDWNANDQFKNPRGIRGYQLIGGGDFDLWRMTGNLGGEDFPDKVRGPLNEGGFWAERAGAALPGFDDSAWKKGSPSTGMSSAGISVYRTTFKLNLPTSTDYPLAIKIARDATKNLRAVFYINGWQFGRFMSNFGPQTVFPVPEGIIDHRGTNQLSLILWSLDASGGALPDIELVATGAYSTGKEIVTGLVDSPGYAELRK